MLLLGRQLRIALELLPVALRTAGRIVLQHDRRWQHRRARGVEAFMHQEQRVPKMGAEQPLHLFARKTAGAHAVSEKMNAPPQQPHIGLLVATGGKQLAQGLLRRRLQPFVGIEQDHPGLAGACNGGIFLRAESQPVLVRNDGALGAGNGDRGIGRAGIQHDDLMAQGHQRAQAARDPVLLVQGDDNGGQR
jgi:hypothetical protein